MAPLVNASAEEMKSVIEKGWQETVAIATNLSKHSGSGKKIKELTSPFHFQYSISSLGEVNTMKQSKPGSTSDAGNENELKLDVNTNQGTLNSLEEHSHLTEANPQTIVDVQLTLYSFNILPPHLLTWAFDLVKSNLYTMQVFYYVFLSFNCKSSYKIVIIRYVNAKDTGWSDRRKLRELSDPDG
jgi:hypothetical protein